MNTNGKIGDLLFNSGARFTFHSCLYLQTEIERHKPKLLKIAKAMNEAQLDAVIALVIEQLSFVEQIPTDSPVHRKAYELVSDIDPFDVDFVALAMHLNATLWTGDKVLHTGLRRKGYTAVCTTDELWTLRGW